MPGGEKIKEERRILVEPAEDGLRLDLLLSRRYDRFSRADWQKRIKDGRVQVDEAPARASRKMRSGESIRFVYERPPEPAVDRDVGTVYEDEHLLLLSKPGNLPMYAAGNYRQNTLHRLLKETYGESFRAHFAHRLDRETSGLLLLAKNPPTAARLQKLFATGGVRKEYITIVEGAFPEYLDADGWIGRDEKSVIRRKRVFAGKSFRSAATCRTEFFRLQQSPELSLLRVRLHSGRLHQIRATLCSLGFPVTGDRMYGVDETAFLRLMEDTESDEDRIRLRLNRTAVHATRLAFRHPVSGEQMDFFHPPPPDMNSLFPQYQHQPVP